MPTVWLFDPLDFVFFRNARPFDAGASDHSATIFPLPRTFYGAMRTSVLLHGTGEPGVGGCTDLRAYADGCEGCADRSDCTLPAIVGHPGGPAAFRLAGPVLAEMSTDETTLYFPPPRTWVTGSLREQRDVLSLRPAREDSVDIARSPGVALRRLRVRAERVSGAVADVGDCVVRAEALERWLAADRGAEDGVLPSAVLRDRAELLVPDWREGLAIDPETGTALDGHLFRQQVFRTAATSCAPDGSRGATRAAFALEVDDPWPRGERLVHLGGERRLSRLMPDESTLTSFAEAVPCGLTESDRRVLLYLATPAWFGGSLLPLPFAADKREIEWHGATVRLVSAAVAETSVAGFDYAKRRATGIERGVDAGSVYFLEVVTGSALALRDKVHGQCISDEPHAAAGFGLAFLGRWNEC